MLETGVEEAVDTCPERMGAADTEVRMQAAVDNCPERVNVVDAEAAEPVRSEAGMALEGVLALEAVLALGVVLDVLQ